METPWFGRPVISLPTRQPRLSPLPTEPPLRGGPSKYCSSNARYARGALMRHLRAEQSGPSFISAHKRHNYSSTFKVALVRRDRGTTPSSVGGVREALIEPGSRHCVEDYESWGFRCPPSRWPDGRQPMYPIRCSITGGPRRPARGIQSSHREEGMHMINWRQAWRGTGS